MHATLPNPKAQFWDRIAPKYAAKPVKDQAAYAAKLDAVRAVIRPTDTVLEIGCGTGSTALTLAGHVAQYTASDVSPGMIEIAEKKRAAAQGRRPEFVVAEASQPVPNAPFDVVMAFSLLHLVSDLDAVLKTVHEQVWPGGVFLSKTVCLGDTNVAVRAFVRVLRAVGIAPPILFLRADQVRTALRRNGFVIENTSYFGRSGWNPFIVARRVD